ncbi:glutathione S-transferase [Rhizobiaceae bacterium n13]|uniref:Glutathione S-transferase n=1 Tax=Ferirhizobium litorale TaxID=2927786 RepID=A0AAE3U137_9HYPH|nr:glutathione S-transferase [Fererhizobium litorale]MDI7861060.1 glutathione S-transferase [Fererhizobium litorale]MDI7921207.1 glutathione S-transferase [Fererhizobium litorale]
MRLLYSSTSPYSSKVRMAATYLGVEHTEVACDTNAAPPELIDNNPLGKIPTLIMKDGRSIFDSRSIMHYFDRESGGKLYPKKKGRRTEAEVLEALCDGITDCLLSIVYEKRFRPDDIIHQPWIDKQWTKVARALDYLDANLPKAGKKLHGGHFALAAMLGYLSLRFAGQWEKGREKLVAWQAKFGERFEDYGRLKPQ